MKLSVCIPVYNVAPYIERCARSLFEQTYRDIEYIFVDNASSDDGVVLLERRAAEYPDRVGSVKIIRQAHNMGAMPARRAALEAATGDLIAFCDADDWVDPDLYQRMIACLESSGADAVMCKTRLEYPDGHSLDQGIEGISLQGADAVRRLAQIPGASSLVLRIVRREMLLDCDLEWPVDLACGEDLMLSVQVLHRCVRLVSVDAPCCYHYRQNAQSAIHTITAERIVHDHIKVYDVLRRKIPDDEVRAVCCYLTRVILFWGAAFAILDAPEFELWRGRFESLGGEWDWSDKSLWGQRMMKLAHVNYALARLVAPFLRRRICDYL